MFNVCFRCNIFTLSFETTIPTCNIFTLSFETENETRIFIYLKRNKNFYLPYEKNLSVAATAFKNIILVPVLYLEMASFNRSSIVAYFLLFRSRSPLSFCIFFVVDKCSSFFQLSYHFPNIRVCLHGGIS